MPVKEWIVRDPASGVVMARLGHNSAHGTPDDLEAFAALLIRAAYEARKGLHDAPSLPASSWRPGEIKDIAET